MKWTELERNHLANFEIEIEPTQFIIRIIIKSLPSSNSPSQQSVQLSNQALRERQDSLIIEWVELESGCDDCGGGGSDKEKTELRQNYSNL